MKQKLSLLLALLLLASGSLTACSNSSSDESGANGTNTPSEGGETDPVETEPEVNVYDEAIAALPSTTYNGDDFTILSRLDTEYEMNAEEQTAEATNDAVYARNLRIEDRYKIKINTETTGGGNDWDEITDRMRASVHANDHLYDLVGQVDFKTYALVGNDLCGNWLDVPHLNLEADWWAQLANDDATINGRLFTMTGDLCISNILLSFGLFYNADLIGNYGITTDQLQQSVFDYKWTYDYFNSLVSNVYDDTDGGGTPDENDVFGFAASPGNHCDAWLTAFNQPITNVKEDGTIEVVMFTEKTVQALEKVNALYHDNVGTYNPGEWLDVFPMFANGHALFTPGTLNDARTSLANMQSEFGLLPLPMWEEAQGMYYTSANDQFTVIAYPIDTDPNALDFLGTITEALAIESKRDVTSAFYDSALKNRYSMDPNTAKIIDIIAQGRLFEFALQYGNDILLPYMFRNQIIAGTNNIASEYDSQQKVIDKQLRNIAGYYGLGE